MGWEESHVANYLCDCRMCVAVLAHRRKFYAGIMLCGNLRQASAIVVPNHSEWQGFNEMDRDGEL